MPSIASNLQGMPCSTPMALSRIKQAHAQKQCDKEIQEQTTGVIKLVWTWLVSQLMTALSFLNESVLEIKQYWHDQRLEQRLTGVNDVTLIGVRHYSPCYCSTRMHNNMVLNISSVIKNILLYSARSLDYEWIYPAHLLLCNGSIYWDFVCITIRADL